MNQNFTSKAVLSSINMFSNLRQQYIDKNAFDVVLYKVQNDNSLNLFGEPGYYSTREKKIIKLIPAFKNQYSLLSFKSPGVVNEADFKKTYSAYVQNDEEIDKNDIIEISYVYDKNLPDIKYYQVKKIVISAILRSFSKKLILEPYSLPMEMSEASNITSEYEGIVPNKNFI